MAVYGPVSVGNLAGGTGVTIVGSPSSGEYPTKIKIESSGYWRNNSTVPVKFRFRVYDIDSPGVQVQWGETGTVSAGYTTREYLGNEYPIGYDSRLVGKKIGFIFITDFNDATFLWGGGSITITTNKQTYTVTWVQDDGTAIDTSTVEYGATPTHSNPSKTATTQYNYAFAAWQRLVNGTWTDGIVKCTGAITYRARYTPTVRSYTIKFVDYDGTELQSGNVAYGNTPVYSGPTPSRSPAAKYEFSGWSPAITSVTGAATYTAQYTIRKYTVTWRSEGTTLETDTDQAYGTTPTYNGATPTKAPTAQIVYVFAGWSPAVAAVTGDAVYFAVFTEQPRPYTITKVVSPAGAGTITAPNSAACGSTVNVSQTPAQDYEFVRWEITGATISGNSFTMPIEDVTLTAVYREAHKTVGYYDGSEMVECIAQYYDGTEWVEIEPHYFDGTEFKLCSLT